MKLVLTAAGIVASTLLAASAASAAPLGSLGSAPAADSLVQQTHGSHRACTLGPAGWHYHSRFRDRRVVCRPPSPGRFWIWRSERGKSGWWHRNERRWR